MLAGAFDRQPKRRENLRIAEVNAGKDVSSAESCERRAHQASYTIAVLFVSPGLDEQWGQRVRRASPEARSTRA
jgi:hypothetical protein